jgi:hypothetical protein
MWLEGSPPQKGVTVYSMSANRQNPLAGTLNNAVFNTARRTRHQILYWAPAMVIAYYSMNWAIERYGIPYVYRDSGVAMVLDGGEWRRESEKRGSENPEWC